MRPRLRARRSVRPLLNPVEILETRVVPAITIQFDYSFDNTNYFGVNPAAKTVLEQAGQFLGSHLNDRLQAITPNVGLGNTWTAEPFDPRNIASSLVIANPSIPADTLVIYAGATALPAGVLGQGGSGGYGASGSSEWLTSVGSRGQAGVDASPRTDIGIWGGSITFSTSATFSYSPMGSTPGNSGTDFFSVALHELGHVLGMVPGGSDYGLVSGANFVGAHSVASFGGPVPLAGDLSHWAEGTLSFGMETTMDPVAPSIGQRSAFTSLDWAGMNDAGWETDALAVGSVPTSVGAGSSFGVTIKAVDPNGRTDTLFNRPVTLGLANNPGGSTLGGTLTVNAVNGVATFSGLRLNNLANGYTLKATTNDNTPSVTTSGFDVVPSSLATKLQMSVVPPPTVTSGTGFGLTVSATNALGAVDVAFSGPITLAIASNPAAGSLGGTVSANAVNGVATFAGLTLDKAGSGYTIRATSSGLTSVTSSGIAVTPASATHFSVVPSGGSNPVADVPFGFRVTALDASENVATGYAGFVEFTSSDALADLPAGFSFVAGDAGTHTFSVTFRTSGSQTIHVDDGVSQGTTNLLVSEKLATTRIESSLSFPIYGQSLSFTAFVEPTLTGGGTPSGFVQFTLDGKNFGTPIALDGNGTVTTPATTAIGVGVHLVGALYSGDSTFAGGPSTPTESTVFAATLTVKGRDQIRAYGDPNAPLAFDITGFENGENPASAGITGTAVFSTTVTATSPVSGGPYAITPIGNTLAAPNYIFVVKPGTLTVAKAILTVAAIDIEREFGDPNPTLSASISGFKNGESPATGGVSGSPVISTQATADSPVTGSPYAIDISAGTLAASNYVFVFKPGSIAVRPSSVPLVTVLSVQAIKTKKAVTTIAIRLSGAIDPSRVASLSAYALAQGSTVRKKLVFTKAVLLKTAIYDQASNRITLILKKSAKAGTKFQVTIRDNALNDAKGRAIDGNRDGQVGGSFVGKFNG